MKTLKEIEEIIFPKEKIDLVEIAKDLLIQKYGESKLVTFNETSLYDVGDPILTLDGLAVVNNQLIAMTHLNYGGDNYGDIFGRVYDGEKLDNNKGVGVPNEVLNRVCQKLFKGGKNIHVEFDFITMKGTDDDCMSADYLEENLKDNEGFIKVLNGKCGYVEL